MNDITMTTRQDNKTLGVSCGRLLTAAALAILCGISSAADFSVKAGSWAFGGTCSVSCPNPGNWKIKAEPVPSNTPDVSFVRVRLSSEKPAKLPVFKVRAELAIGDARMLWRASLGCRKHDRAGVLPFVSHASFASSAANWMPLYAFIDEKDGNVLTLASSESRSRVVFHGGTVEGPNTLRAEFTFNTKDCDTPVSRYETTLLFDARRIDACRTLSAASAWMRAADPAPDRPVPPSAFEPAWSSWCAYHTGVTEETVEREAAAARDVGLDWIILDDGWQVPAGLGFCQGENLPNIRYSKDFAAHIRRLHDAGTKVVLWYPVPLATDNAPNFADYAGQMLYRRSWGPYVWDPRFPARRDFFLGRISAAMRDWKVDGLKLDFIDSWGIDYDGLSFPDVSKGLAGRDIRDLTPAVAQTMTAARAAVSDIQPDALIEFRQSYMGPLMLKCCTQMRVQDCPGSLSEMRYGIANLRLTSGPNAVHSDPIQWARDASAESVAESILASIFGIGQYSIRLTESPRAHLDILKRWIAFTRTHAAALYRGDFRIQGISSDAPVLVGETKEERIVGVYKPNFAAECGAPDRPVIILNGTGTPRVTVRFDGATSAEVFGPDGAPAGKITIPAGLSDIAIPRGGYAACNVK